MRRLRLKSFLIGILLGLFFLSFQVQPTFAFPFWIITKPTRPPKPPKIIITKPPIPKITIPSIRRILTPTPTPTVTPTVMPSPTSSPTPTPTPSLTPTPTIITDSQISYIVSDTSWKYSDIEVSGWTNISFDDSSWLFANGPSDGLCPPSAINIEGRMDQHGAMPIWTQNPINRSTAYFRKTFTLSSLGKRLVRALFDDDGDIYINGTLVLSNHDGHVSGVSYVDVSPYLVVGENVIAIKAIDAGGCQSIQFELGMNQLLDDDFRAITLNTNFWEVFPNNGVYSLSNGFIVIPGGNTPGMPFFRTKENPFPVSGSFSVEFGIQYTTIFPAGIGLVVSDGQQPNVTTPGAINDLIGIWQDNGAEGLRFAQQLYVRTTLGHNDINYHVVKFIYDGEKYLAYFDGELKYTSLPAIRATGLWFGHPYYSDLPGWTGFKLDYIKVTSL